MDCLPTHVVPKTLPSCWGGRAFPPCCTPNRKSIWIPGQPGIQRSIHTLDLSYLAWFPQEPWEGGKAGLTRHLTNKETEAQIPSLLRFSNQLTNLIRELFPLLQTTCLWSEVWNVDNECLSLEQCVISRGCTITIIRYFISILICTYSSDFVVMVNTFLSWRKYSAPWALLFCHSLY